MCEVVGSAVSVGAFLPAYTMVVVPGGSLRPWSGCSARPRLGSCAGGAGGGVGEVTYFSPKKTRGSARPAGWCRLRSSLVTRGRLLGASFCCIEGVPGSGFWVLGFRGEGAVALGCWLSDLAVRQKGISGIPTSILYFTPRGRIYRIWDSWDMHTFFSVQPPGIRFLGFAYFRALGLCPGGRF